MKNKKRRAGKNRSKNDSRMRFAVEDITSSSGFITNTNDSQVRKGVHKGSRNGGIYRPGNNILTESRFYKVTVSTHFYF